MSNPRVPGAPTPPSGVNAYEPEAPQPYSADQEPVGVSYPNQPALEAADPEELAAIQSLEERRKRRRRGNIIKAVVACAIVVFVIAAFAVGGAISSAMQNASKRPELISVEKDNFITTIQATGSLKPGSHVAVTPEVSGVIQEVLVTEGQQVQAGDTLLTLKNTELEKSLADAGSALKRAKKSLEDAKAGVSGAWDTYNDAINAYNAAVDVANNTTAHAVEIASEAYTGAYNAAVASIPSTVSEAERDELLAQARANAQSAYDTAYEAAISANPGIFDHTGYLANIDASQAAVDQNESLLEDAQRAYDYAVEEAGKRTVKAPVAGTVLDLKAIPGAAVGGATGGTSVAGETLMQIADLSALSVDIEVNEIDIVDVKPGQRVKVTFTAVPDLELSGAVATVASVASGSSTPSQEASPTSSGVVTFKVTAVISAPDERLKPGMSASVSIITNELPNSLVIPSSSVSEDEEGSYVLVALDESGAQTERRDIVVGERSGSKVEVKSGLEEGELILLSSLDNSLGSLSASSSSSSSSAG